MPSDRYSHAGFSGGARPHRQDDPDWDSDEDEDPLGDSLSSHYADPYSHRALILHEVDAERRLAAARGAALAARKCVPTIEFVASLEKLNPKDIKEADRSKFGRDVDFGIIADVDSVHDLL